MDWSALLLMNLFIQTMIGTRAYVRLCAPREQQKGTWRAASCHGAWRSIMSHETHGRCEAVDNACR